jgi:hypothetical protein
MRDMELYALMFGLLAQEGPKRDLVGYEFTQRYQPTQEGVSNAPTIYLFKVGGKRYGFRSVKQIPKIAPAEGLTRIETQDRETTLQFSVTQPLNTDMAARTHSDTLNLVASVMQSPDFIKLMIQNKASILRITDVRMAQVINDKGQWEENPSFDAVIKHADVWIDGVEEAKTFEFRLYAI